MKTMEPMPKRRVLQQLINLHGQRPKNPLTISKRLWRKKQWNSMAKKLCAKSTTKMHMRLGQKAQVKSSPKVRVIRNDSVRNLQMGSPADKINQEKPKKLDLVMTLLMINTVLTMMMMMVTLRLLRIRAKKKKLSAASKKGYFKQKSSKKESSKKSSSENSSSENSSLKKICSGKSSSNGKRQVPAGEITKTEGQVCCEYSGEKFYEKLKPSRETKSTCYASTHNGNIKSLDKDKSDWWLVNDNK